MRFSQSIPMILLLVVSALPPASHVWAAMSPDTATLPPSITVSKGTIAVADDTHPESQTSFSKKISRDQFKTTTGSVVDVIQQETGVQLRQRGGLGGASAVYLRGSDSQQVNVYLDGLLVNAAAGGGVDLSQFLLNSVDAVEIYPDVTPVALGFPNLAGAINIKTRKVGDQSSDVQWGGGSFGAFNAGVHLNEVRGAHSALLAVEYLEAENDFRLLNNNGTSFNSLDDRWERRHNSQFDQTNALIKYDYALQQDAGLQLMLLNNRKDQGLPNARNSATNRTSLDTESTQVQARIYEGYSNNRSVAVRGYYTTTEELYDDRQSSVGLGSNWNLTDTTAYGINPSIAWLLDEHVITASIEGKREQFDQKNLLRSALSPDWQRQGINVAVQDEWQNSDGRWLVVPAISVLWIDDHGNLSGSSLDQENVDRTDHYVTSRLGVKYLFNEAWVVKGNVSDNVRVPSLFELMGDRGFIQGDSSLSSEKSLATDVGVEYCATLTSLSFTVFHRDIDDALVVSYDSRGVGRYQNIGKAEITGLELSVDRHLSLGFSASLRTTLQDPRDRTKRALEADDVLPNVYRHASGLGVMHRWQRVENRIDFSVEEGGYYAPGETTEIPDKHVIDYSLRYQWQNTQLTFEAKNLLDKQYEDFNRYPAPGRHYFIKATHSF